MRRWSPRPDSARRSRKSHPQLQFLLGRRSMARSSVMKLATRLRDDQNGRVSAYVVITAVAALAFGGLVLDGGLALAAKVRAMGQAQEAARAGAQEIDLAAYRADGTLRLEPSQAFAAAQNHLSPAHLIGSVSRVRNTFSV